MVITEILISNFRSIKKLSWNVKPATVICGINSCGKSNVLRALKFAFLPSYDVGKMVDSICSAALSPNAEAQIKLTFDRPTAALARVLGIPAGTSFTYEVKVKRNATMKAYLNGSLLDSETRAAFLAQVLIVYVPPLRDIGADGLAPFQKALADSLSKMKGTNSFNRQASSLKDIVRSRSKSLLSATQELSKSQLRVDELVVDTDGLDFKALVPRVGIKFKISGKELSLDRLGTGHQSAVVLDLYRQLGETADLFTIYLFEEPDNHLHPTSLKAIAADLVKCSKKANSQIFLTTHSPYLLNQFPVENYLALSVDLNRLTVRLKTKNPRDDRKMRDAFGRFGLTPAEALLSKKVLVVEGPNDVTLFRTLVELQTGCSAERQDILIVNAGGKNPVTQLAELLNELGVTWLAAFDWDASIDTRHSGSTMSRASFSSKKHGSAKTSDSAISGTGNASSGHCPKFSSLRTRFFYGQSA
jgi:predicted ATP-dependent endonuclease of OLD family